LGTDDAARAATGDQVEPVSNAHPGSDSANGSTKSELAKSRCAIRYVHLYVLLFKEENRVLLSPQPQGGPADLALVTGLKSGDQVAMAELYDRYSPVVYAVALRVLGDTGAAEDVLQEVFLQLWRKPSAFDSARGSLGSWLAVITWNRAIDCLRKRKPETEIEEVVLSVTPDLAGDSDRARVAEKVRGVIESMITPQRSALEMAYWQGMSHSEIAKKTGEPLGTVKTRIRAGLIALRKAFQT